MWDDLNRRAMFAGALGVAGAAAVAANAAEPEQKASQRLGQRYRFADDDMDLFFVAALGWGVTGGLALGQAWYVASQIKDGDGDSWVAAFEAYGDAQNAEADALLTRGRTRSAGETRLKAFASYRSAWQFAPPGAVFLGLFAKQQAAFGRAMTELKLPATRFMTPYKGKQLPGVFLRNPNPKAATVLVIGGADTSHEDLFLTAGRGLLERGYSVALVDLPGQGIVQNDGLFWEVEAEKPIAAVVDQLVGRFKVKPGRLALLGLSLGGYFACRAAGYETRLATVVASTPFPNPGRLFALSARNAGGAAPSGANLRNIQTLMWKAGAKSPADLLARTQGMVADPARVTVPFLSILGGGESKEFPTQARAWHAAIPSSRKALVVLDAATGADGHCQVNNRLRLVQETSGWLDEVFA